MLRQIIKIDEKKCNGCGLCVSACHEGAIGMIDGKARLLRDDYCDGLGDCLPVCPTGAISFEEREAAAYNEEEVLRNMEAKAADVPETLACGCPGTHMQSFERPQGEAPQTAANNEALVSQLTHWPVQIKLVPTNAPYFEGANLLIAADCTAFAHANFNQEFMKNKVTLVGCPKLDEGDYAEKFTAIIRDNDIKSVVVARMEVPCCGGMESAVKTALKNSGKMIPWHIVTLAMNGEVLEA